MFLNFAAQIKFKENSSTIQNRMIKVSTIMVLFFRIRNVLFSTTEPLFQQFRIGLYKPGVNINS
jgi:hypothetical protein